MPLWALSMYKAFFTLAVTSIEFVYKNLLNAITLYILMNAKSTCMWYVRSCSSSALFLTRVKRHFSQVHFTCSGHLEKTSSLVVYCFSWRLATEYPPADELILGLHNHVTYSSLSLLLCFSFCRSESCWRSLFAILTMAWGEGDIWRHFRLFTPSVTFNLFRAETYIAN